MLPKQYTLISAQTKGHSTIKHKLLKTLLTKLGFTPIDVNGVYGNPELSLLVPHFGDIADLTLIENLGYKFNQESVLHSSNGYNTLVYLNDFEDTVEGIGIQSAKGMEDLYTNFNGFKFQLKLNFGD